MAQVAFFFVNVVRNIAFKGILQKDFYNFVCY